MEIRFAQKQDIDAWMALVERVRDVFPGLETAGAMAEHRNTVLRFIAEQSALCAVEGDQIAGALLFSRDPGALCFLAVDPSYRRRQIARQLVARMLDQLEEGKSVTVTTYRQEDPRGVAARAFYRRMGFMEGELTEEFGCPVQEFILPRQRENESEDAGI